MSERTYIFAVHCTLYLCGKFFSNKKQGRFAAVPAPPENDTHAGNLSRRHQGRRYLEVVPVVFFQKTSMIIQEMLAQNAGLNLTVEMDQAEEDCLFQPFVDCTSEQVLRFKYPDRKT